MRRRVLITGASGMLGSMISRVLGDDQGLEVWNLDRKPAAYLRGEQVRVDLMNDDDIKRTIADVRPDFLVHCAALVNIEECEKDRESAYRLHVTAVRTLLESGGEKMRTIHISTDSVFDGKRGGYTESDPAQPVNYYARTKLLGEEIVTSLSPRSLVLRTNIYGFHRDGGHSLAEWAVNRFQSAQAVNGFDDVVFNPLYVGQLAQIIHQLLFQDAGGILHVGARGSLSKYEFLRKLAVAFGYDPSLVRRAQIRDASFEVPRPSNTSLNVSQFERLIGPAPAVDEGISQLAHDYLRQADGAVRDEDN